MKPKKHKPKKKMAHSIISNASLQFLDVSGVTYVQLPIGTTGFQNPTIAANQGSWSASYPNEWDFEYDPNDTVKSADNKTFGRYVGGRPTGR